MLSPAHFPDSLTFSLDRWLVDDHKSNRYLMPFGRGTRGCLGQQKYASPPSFHLHVSSLTPSQTPPYPVLTINYRIRKHSLALAEITLAIAFLFHRFEFSLHDTDARAVNVTRDRFAAGLDRGSKGTRVRVVRAYGVYSGRFNTNDVEFIIGKGGGLAAVGIDRYGVGFWENIGGGELAVSCIHTEPLPCCLSETSSFAFAVRSLEDGVYITQIPLLPFRSSPSPPFFPTLHIISKTPYILYTPTVLVHAR